MNENNFEFLDFLTVLAFYMQVTQIRNNNKHMQEIENKLNYIISKLDLIDDQVLASLMERFDSSI